MRAQRLHLFVSDNVAHVSPGASDLLLDVSQVPVSVPLSAPASRPSVGWASRAAVPGRPARVCTACSDALAALRVHGSAQGPTLRAAEVLVGDTPC